MIGKVEEKKVGPDAFHLFNLAQSSFLGGVRAYEVPASIALEIIRSYLHLAGPALFRMIPKRAPV